MYVTPNVVIAVKVSVKMKVSEHDTVVTVNDDDDSATKSSIILVG